MVVIECSEVGTGVNNMVLNINVYNQKLPELIAYNFSDCDKMVFLEDWRKF